MHTQSAADLTAIAEHSSQLAKIIRDWLPFDGESDAKVHNWKTADSWFTLAADHYANCEIIRNPSGLPFIERGGSYHGPRDSGPFWFELCYALDAIAIVYRWQGLSDGSGISCSFAWRETIPEIPSGVLNRLERAAAGLKTLTESREPEQMPAAAGQMKNNVPQTTDVSEFFRLQNLSTWKDKPKAAIFKEIARQNAKKTKQLLTESELRTEAERIKKAVRDYENKVNKKGT